MSEDEDEETVLTVELEFTVPKDINMASKDGGQLGRVLFSKVIVALRNLMYEQGATGQDASNAILNAQIVCFAYTLITTIAAMEGSSMLPEDLEAKFPSMLMEVMKFTSDVFGRHAKQGLYTIRERPPKEGP